MRLVLYSGGLPEQNQELDAHLLRMVGTINPKITVIPSSFAHREEDYADFESQFSMHGLRAHRIFDADCFQSSGEIAEAFSADMIYLSGGNTFYFLASLRRFKLLKHLKSFAKRDGVLAGKSAGAIMMTPHIETAGFPDFDRDENEVGISNLKALNLVDFEFFPHYKNRRSYEQAFSRYTRYSERPLYACPDGSGIVVYDRQTVFVGDVSTFFAGEKFRVNPTF